MCQIPETLRSTTNSMTVVLRTDHSISHRGFRARWSTDEPAGKFVQFPPNDIENGFCDFIKTFLTYRRHKNTAKI